MFPSLDDELQQLEQVLALSVVEMKALRARTARFPQAAGILLPLLRHQEQNNDATGLLAESLAYGTLQQGGEFRQWLDRQRNMVVKQSAQSQDSIVLVSREQNILRIRLNRPEARNAYSAAMRDALFAALTLLDLDHSIERCIWDAVGDCFSVGGDLAEFGVTTDIAQAHHIRMCRPIAALLLENASRIECRVHRACIGSGIELAGCAGKLVATDNTFFQLPELSMGLIPGAGGTVSLLRRLGRHRLAWWILSGRRISARTALDWGLIDQIQP